MVDFYLSQLEISQFFEFFGKIIAPFQGSVTDKFPGNIIDNSLQDGPKIFFSKSDKEIFYKGQFGRITAIWAYLNFSHNDRVIWFMSAPIYPKNVSSTSYDDGEFGKRVGMV